MPEGDTIFRAARTLHRALTGRMVVRFESVFPALMRVHEDWPITGRTVVDVKARGKHLLMTFSGDLVLHTHMKMSGSWHIYRPGERWQRPARDMRIVVGTDAFVAVGFNVPVAELMTSRELARHHQIAALGPDPLDQSCQHDEVIRRMRTHHHEAIGDVLLNQRVLAGLGNVLKSETLFAAGIYPFARIDDLDDLTLGRLIDVARRLLEVNTAEGNYRAPQRHRRTTGRMNPAEPRWVYSRGGKPCRRCGALIESRKGGDDARVTYWCPRCQRASPVNCR
jgi:endonuclease-8